MAVNSSEFDEGTRTHSVYFRFDMTLSIIKLRPTGHACVYLHRLSDATLSACK